MNVLKERESVLKRGDAMSAPGKLQTLIAGEASESDEEGGQHVLPITKPKDAQKSRLGSLGKVVSGEASESEEEDEVDLTASTVTPLKVDESGQGDGSFESDVSKPHIPAIKVEPKYDTILHHKLREKNSLFQDHLREFVAHAYTKAAKDIRTISQHLAKPQHAVQDVSHCMSLLTNDLFHLEDKIDIVATCNIILDIEIDIPPDTAASGSQSQQHAGN